MTPWIAGGSRGETVSELVMAPACKFALACLAEAILANEALHLEPRLDYEIMALE